MKKFFSLGLFASAKAGLFEDWTAEHWKSYETAEEEKFRKGVFEENVAKIEQINKENRSWTAGLNKFSDLTWDEFQHFYLMQAGQDCSATSYNSKEYLAKGVEQPMPTSWDWRKDNKVSPVKDQGQCGSCWTFSTTGNVEAGEAIHLNEYHTLSEQQLVDCAGAFNNHGCNGGLPSQAFEYIAAAPGIMTEADYPYTAKDGNCVFDQKKAAVHVYGSVNITRGDEVEMAEAMVMYQPISIAFEVVDDFMHYKSGTYSSKDCKGSPTDVNHAVLAVGFGTDGAGTDFWTVKNSWSKDWGNQGYFNIQRGVNMCGLSQCTSFALIKPDN